MHYYIDGYNLFFQLPEEKRSLENGREQIIAALLNVKLSLAIVFDGRGDPLSERTNKGALEIVYTAKCQTADNYILDELGWVKHPGDYTVVTSDKKLATLVRAAGGRCQTIASFLAMIRKKQAVKVKEKPFQDTTKDLERLLKIFTRQS